LLVMGRVSVPQTEMARQYALQLLQARGLPLTMLTGLAGGESPTAAPSAQWGSPAPVKWETYRGGKKI